MLILETSFHIFLAVIYVTLNVKTLKNFMYFWLPRIACTKLMLLCINYTTNAIIAMLSKRILGIMLPVRTSLLCEFILVKFLVYFSIPHPRFVSLFKSSLLYIYLSCILASQVCFSQVKLNRTQSGR